MKYSCKFSFVCYGGNCVCRKSTFKGYFLKETKAFKASRNVLMSSNFDILSCSDWQLDFLSSLSMLFLNVSQSVLM